MKLVCKGAPNMNFSLGGKILTTDKDCSLEVSEETAELLLRAGFHLHPDEANKEIVKEPVTEEETEEETETEETETEEEVTGLEDLPPCPEGPDSPPKSGPEVKVKKNKKNRFTRNK